jgi:hypothetical protein
MAAATRIKSEPAACGKKYSVALFHVGVVEVKNSSGINLIMLISRAAQMKNQSVEFKATNVEAISEVSKRKYRLLNLSVVLKVIVTVFSNNICNWATYEAHSREPSTHSYNSPYIRTSRNIQRAGVEYTIKEEVIRGGRGKRKAISISKIRNTTASKKNRREKGVRAEFFGSNPHSYGESLSRSDEKVADR